MRGVRGVGSVGVGVLGGVWVSVECGVWVRVFAHTISLVWPTHIKINGGSKQEWPGLRETSKQLTR